jgi:hypothetical protein
LDNGLLEPDHNESVDIIRSLIVHGQNDPLHLDFRGGNFITGYMGNADGYMWLLCQEEFELDIVRAGDRPLYVIARSLGAQLNNDVTCIPSRSWEPVFRRLIELGLSPISKYPGMETTPLDTPLLSIEDQAASGPVMQEWVSLLVSVGVNIEEYVSVERLIHASGFVSSSVSGPEFSSRVRRQMHFEDQLKIEWTWHYDVTSTAYAVLTEYSTFGNIFSDGFDNWQVTWPFIHVESYKALVPYRSMKEYQENLLTLEKLEARWARQAARRQYRRERTLFFSKPSRSERWRRIPGSRGEDRLAEQTCLFEDLRATRFPHIKRDLLSVVFGWLTARTYDNIGWSIIYTLMFLLCLSFFYTEEKLAILI